MITPPQPMPSRHVAEDPVMLARYAITLFDQKLQRDYGLNAVMGAELECSVLAPIGANLGLLDKSDSAFYDFTPSVIRPPEQRDAWFPESGRVNRTYLETCHGTPWQQVEVVLTHKPIDEHGTHLPHDSAALADAIRDQRRDLHALLIERSRPESAKIPPIDKLSFEPFIESTRVSNALQLNMHLVDADENPWFDHPHAIEAMQNAMGEMAEENLFLLGSSYGALYRLQNKFHDRPAIGKMIKARETIYGYYLENRLPAADSNPYYAVLLQLAGAERALSRDVPAEKPEPLHMEDMAQLSPSLLLRKFQRGQMLREALNELEPELGNRFYHAIAMTPPGKERTAHRE